MGLQEGSPEVVSCGQQAQRCGADPGLRRETPDLSRSATGARTALRGVGAHRARAPVIQGQNRVRTDRRRSSVPRRRPPECKDRPGGEACGPGCGLQEALCFPRRGPGGWRFQQRWMHLRPLCLKNGNWGGSPVCPVRSVIPLPDLSHPPLRAVPFSSPLTP